MMKTGCTGTERPKNGTGGLRRVVLALAVLLLTCVLMAGAVSADDDVTTVNNYDQLIEALADESIGSIKLTTDITATAEILVNRSVTIDGDGKKITANFEKGSDTTNDHLMQIEKKSDKVTVNLTNLQLDSAKKVKGLNIFEPGGEITLTDLTLTNSTGSGITINGATVKASGLEISGSEWGQSIDIGFGHPKNIDMSKLILTGTNTLSDVYQINTDNPTEDVQVNAPGYKRYDWFYDYTDKSGDHSYAHYKSTWTTNPDFTTAVDLPKDPNTKAPVLVLNSSTATPALHKDLVNATKYVEDGATIQLLGDVTLKETAEVTNGVTLDLNGHTIKAQKKDGDFKDNTEITPPIPTNLINVTGGALTFKGTGSLDGYNGVQVNKGSATITSGVTITSTNSGVRLYGHQQSSSDTTTVDIQNGAKLTGENGVGIYGDGYDAKATRENAYNVKLTMNGDIQVTSFGVFTNGYIKQGDPAILIGPHAKIEAEIPVYGPNNAVWTIEDGAVITGGEALSIKGGNWIINGGTFTATGEHQSPTDANTGGSEPSGAAVSITSTYADTVSASVNLTINGGTFTSQNGHAVMVEASKNDEGVWYAGKVIKGFNITGGTFNAGGNKAAISVNTTLTDLTTLNIIGGKYSKPMNTTVLTLPTGYEIIDDGSYQTVARIESSPTAEVKSEASGAQNVTVSAPGTPGKLQLETTGAQSAESVTLNVSENTDVKLILHAKEGETLTIDKTNNSVIGNVTKVTYIPNETVLQNTDNVSFKMHFNVQDLAKVLNGGIKIQVTNSPASGDYTGTYARAFSVTILSTNGAELHNTDVELGYTQKSGYTYKVIHAKDGSRNNVVFTYAGGKFKFIAPSFSSYVITETPTPASTSSGGSSAYSFRVLFNDGSTTLSVVTDLSYGDKLTKPATPVKDGYTFAGWYKDSACTQAWDFETGIPGDMTLYAKWTAAGSSGETEATTAPTATSTAVTTPQPTKTQSTTATTSAPQATTAAGVSPTLTQAPAPVAGALFGLLAAGVLLRRRFQ